MDSDKIGLPFGREEEPVVCAGCGRKALQGDGTTAGADTWWEVWPPFAVGEAAGGLTSERLTLDACSLDCAIRAIDKLRLHYKRLEEELLNHPEHIQEEGSA